MAPSRGPQPISRDLHVEYKGHKGAVNVARYAKGAAKYVLTGGQDRTIRLWNANSGTEIKTFAAHGYEVLSITVAHDNAKFGSSGGDRSVFVWDVATGMTTRRLGGHMTKVQTVEFNEDASVIASGLGSHDSTVRLWDLRAQSRQPIQTLEEARDTVQTLYVGQTYIIAGSVDGHVRTYDLRKGQLRSDFIGHPVTSVVPTQDSTTYLVTTLDNHIRLMDMATGKMLNDFSGHTNESYRCRACFGYGEASVLCGDEKGFVWDWDLLDAKIIPPNPPPKAHHKVITWTEHHPTDPNELLTCSGDGTAKIWKTSSPDPSE
ncbi:nuclear mRNA splicing protein [Coprinopsis marcescibilis]|uniref:Nuclear mRNA splicing protein n=1 Tax=Coprinopsis marcescibilis TaxID=230819 RepID=A0A5C3LDI2_COPMA|nr:nuclear mRNA splicing protein [Coprinopsis marcescibilis]